MKNLVFITKIYGDSLHTSGEKNLQHNIQRKCLIKFCIPYEEK